MEKCVQEFFGEKSEWKVVFCEKSEWKVVFCEKSDLKVVVDNEGCKALYVSKRCEKELEQDRHVLNN